MTIYDVRRWGTALFMLLVVVVVGAFLWFSNSLVKDLAEQERARMQIWANATREMATITSGETDIPLESSFFDFLLNIIEENRNIPVLLTDDGGNIITHRNFELPEPIDSGNPMYISPINMAFLQGKLEGLRESQNVIHITISPGLNQHLYYEDSKLLRSLNFYPYVQVVVMVMFVLVVYFAVSSTKKAEQNKVWVGLSKETAHQLGTPISSLMAWTQLMPDFGVPQDVVGEMDKDVKRLETIASRFSKIGSVPALEPENLNEVVRRSVTYMATRISSQIALTADYAPQDLPVSLSAPLFEWVMENLIKNAVDAMAGNGAIHVVTSRDNTHAIVEVTDTGKGIPRKNFKTVFRPGYTTKKRGWGLGLALAKRIIEEYHRGSIVVASSTPGEGTTFRITLPLA